MLSKKVDLSTKKESETDHTTTYGRRYFGESVPKYVMPEDGMPARAAYQLIHDELNLDGNPVLKPCELRDHVDGAGGEPAHRGKP